MNNPIVRVSALVVGVVIGFGITWGFLLLLKDGENTEHPRPTDSEESEPKEAIADSTSTTTAEAIEHQTVPDEVTDLTIPRHLFDQKHAIATWIVSLDRDQTLNWLKQSTQEAWDVPTVFRTKFQSALVQKLSQNSPEQALEFASARIEPVRSTLGSIVFFEWVTNDLDGAIAHAKTATVLTELDRYWVLHSILESQVGLTLDQQQEVARELGDESYALTFYFQSLLTNEIDDPENLWYEVVELAVPDNRQHLDTLEAVANAWIDQAGLEIFDEISASITDKNTLQDVAFGVLYGRADDEEQTEGIFEYVFNLHDDFPWKGFILRSTINKWARYDHMAVLTRAETLPPSSYRQEMLETGHREKARLEPKTTLENLDSLPLGLRESVSTVAIRELAEKSPTDAVNVVLNIDDEELQMMLASSVVYTWSKHDLEATKNWILSLPEGGSLRNGLLAPLANLLVASDPRLAFQIALQQSLQQNGENLSPHEISIVRRIAQNDIELAIELLPKVREESRLSTYRAVAGTLIGNGNSQRAILLVNDLTETEQLDYFQNSLWNWIEKDAEGLKNSIGEIENTGTRSNVVLMMIGLNTHTNAYSDEELQSLKQHLTEEHKEAMKQLDAESSP